ncbi:MAG: hypothetical protein AUJ92_17940 [Armatimonadetes bacterium CG2_30_59_28]|nr:antitoxin family protein [Armatimonadota bacterium]OIO90788.1 MAG: hypothetical protein AUJ92_17940 [Armatimonadetes bacterium CG2_30_59_28]PIU67531.1 MAG: hypothetical protein COS85_00460 [Armatimonadetes bacterium CG07_land_8_20_14_0_80_59_28]PIX45116.1 MAG: hypothetical protein COZ56_02555 [Armatimonadetes bacterium CG_4_8_14_3_um_filter_58_9]PIY40231.1 MAG: hypothetical protein COZ05_17975 [Armatimonadetes bacterium CG_4_10_14_3_um_filter_59_10]PJB75846.1 MAG: hypothetical protein CO095
MPQTVSAVFKEGVFLPLQSVQLRDGDRVSLKVEPVGGASSTPQMPPAAGEYAEPSETDRASLSGLDELWDNGADSIYDNWRSLYAVSEG